MISNKPGRIETLTLRADVIFSIGCKKLEDIKDLAITIPDDIINIINSSVYYIDLDSQYIYGTVVKSRLEREQNAFFDQLRFLKEKKESNDDLMTDLVYIDFSSLYKEKTVNAEEKEDNNNPEKEAEKLFKYGLLLKYDDKFKLLKPFDKSASMSRRSIITFINDSLKEDMNRRLNLDIFDELDDKEKYIPSKVYSYRGLYLSSGIRVECAEFELNEEKVIVIPDSIHDILEYDLPAYTELEEYDEKSNTPPKYGIKIFDKSGKKNRFVVNCFDGEGLISPEYGEILAKYLEIHKMRGANEATSFQIRIPFGKGMLHVVNFKKFLCEEYGVDINTAKILDIYNVERNICDVEIILTQSMFKAYKWIKDHWVDKKRIEDPMKEYFNKMRDYGHALYVVRTDRSLINDGYVRTNYQFLNTGTLSSDEFKSIIEGSLNEYVFSLSNTEPIKEKLLQQNAFQEKSDETNIEDVDPDNPPEANNSISKISEVLKRNDKIIHDPKIKGMISNIIESSYIDAMRGNIMVKGENRFLSGDLLGLLRDIGKRCKKDSDFKFDKVRLRNKFYAPNKCHVSKNNEEFAIYDVHSGFKGEVKAIYPDVPSFSKNIKWNSSFYYAILRNPHLCRNEQCALSPYLPEDENDIYYKYFRHLSGVIMLPYGSPLAERLSGADYDGDIVKIFDNKSINNSAKKCSQSEDEPKNYPLVKIEHSKKNVEKKVKGKDIGGNIEFTTIKDGFNNQIGRISNIALRIGEIEYNENVNNISDDDRKNRVVEQKNSLSGNENQGKSEFTDYAATCCILVGQEIDKAKTGDKPYLTGIVSKGKSLKEKNIGVDLNFIEQKDKVRGLKFKTFEGTMDDEGKYSSFTYPIPSSSSNLMKIDKPEAGAPNLENLMFDVLDLRSGYEKKLQEYKKLENKIYEMLSNKGEYITIPNIKKCLHDLKYPINGKLRKQLVNSIYNNTKDKQVSLKHKSIEESDIDPNIYSTMAAIMISFSQVRKQAEVISRKRRKYENAKYASYVYNILKMQYDSLECHICVSGGISNNMTINDTVYYIYNILDRINESDNTAIESILSRVISEEWQYTYPGNREEKLRDLFENYLLVINNVDRSDNTDIEAKDFFESDLVLMGSILCNFRCHGYNLLYFMLKNILCSDVISKDFENVDLYGKKMEESTTTSLIEQAKSLYRIQYKKYRIDKALDYFIKMVIVYCGTEEEIVNLQKTVRQRFNSGVKYLEDEIVENYFKNKSGFVQQMNTIDLNSIIDMLECIRMIVEKYENFYSKYKNEYEKNNKEKRDVNEDGITDDHKILNYLAQTCRQDIEYSFNQDTHNALLYWGRVHSKLDKNHVFLWNIFTEDEILDSLV